MQNIGFKQNSANPPKPGVKDYSSVKMNENYSIPLLRETHEDKFIRNGAHKNLAGDIVTFTGKIQQEQENDTILDAISFATKAHKGQCRKGSKTSYIVHPLNVAEILTENNCPAEVVIAGILHDTVEDTDVTIEDIRHKFGDKVADIVSGCSEPDKKDSWENRKNHTIEYLKSAPKEVLLVSCADKLDNFRSVKADYKDIGEAIWSRFSRPKEKQAWYYESLAKIFHKQADKYPECTLFSEFYNEVLKSPDSPFVKHSK